MNLSLKSIKKLNPAIILIILIILFVVASALILFFQKKAKNTSNQNPALQNGKYSTIYHFDSAKPDLSKGSVEAKSEIKGQMVEILSQKNLIDMLDSWGIYNKEYDFGKNGRNTKNVSRVVFILTSEEQKNTFMTLPSGKGKTSIDIYAIGNELDVKIYASSEALTHANDFFTYQALYLLYNESHPVTKTINADGRKVGYFKLINDFTQTQPLFVVYQVGYK